LFVLQSRQELVKELKLMDDGDIEPTYNRIADFILAREQRLRDEHLKVLEAIKKIALKPYDFSGKIDMWAVAQGLSDDCQEIADITTNFINNTSQ
jgi:hypothetical protein